MRFQLLSSVLAAALVAAVTAQNHTGDLFYFVPATGACGIPNTPKDSVAAVSNHTFNTFPGATVNPNNNPICKHSLKITRGNVTLTAPIVDYCLHCADTRVGLSGPAFDKFAPRVDGVVRGVTWVIV